MSKIIIQVTNVTSSPLMAGTLPIPVGGPHSFTVEEDSLEQAALNDVVTRGFAALVSTVAFENALDSGVQDVPYAANVTLNPKLGSIIFLGTLTGALTMAAPAAAAKRGQVLRIHTVQDATGGRVITWNAAFKKPADGAGTANQKGTTEFTWDGTHWVGRGLIYG